MMEQPLYLILLAALALFSTEIRHLSRLMNCPPRFFALVLLASSLFLVGCLSGI